MNDPLVVSKKDKIVTDTSSSMKMLKRSVTNKGNTCKKIRISGIRLREET